MSVSKFGSPLKNRGYDARTGRLRPAIESLRSYVRDNALCLSSSIEYDARERKIKRLAQPEEDADATSKSYVEGITSQLRKDANEAGQGVILLFTRLAQLDSALGKRIDVAESFVSEIKTRDDVLSKRIDAVENSISKIETSANALDKRIDVLDKRIKGLSDQIEVAKKTISLNATEFSTRNANDRKVMFNQGKAIQELSQKSRIAANSAVKSETKIRELENSTSRLKRDADELSGRTDKGKEFYKFCEEARSKSLFDIFGDESVDSRTIQSYAQKFYVEVLHAKRNVQVDRRVTTTRRGI
ncbi:tropomyosin-like [Polyergus mexicanus]|uniref:tropomyosin-like n=1 Tax=Polyergus mexicanus TaxID=615972 RepID=UPI0038B5F05D